MKKILTGFLAVCMFVSLCGCNIRGPEASATVFYYKSAAQQEIITQPEKRVLPNNAMDLEESISLYLAGPESDELATPFPDGVQVKSAVLENDTLHLVLSREIAQLSGIPLTIACACLTLTLQTLTGADYIQLQAEGALLGGKNILVLNSNSFIMNTIPREFDD